MDDSETTPMPLGERLNGMAEGWRARLKTRYPEAPIREAIHQGQPVGRFIAIAADPITGEFYGIFAAEFEHESGKLTVTDRIQDEPTASEALPEPFRTFALEPAVGLVTIATGRAGR